MDKRLLDALLDGMFPMEESTKYFKCLIYGDPGSGKTVLGGAIGDRVLHIEADPDGWQSLFNHPELVDNHRMKRMKYQGVSQLETLATALTEGIKEVTQFDTILVDTGSNIANLDLDVVTKKRIQKKGKDAQNQIKFDFDEDMWAAYKENAHRVRMAFLQLFLCDINIVVTAHAREITLKNQGVEQTTKIVPDFSPKILASINGLSSLIAYHTAKGGGVDTDGSVKYTRKIQVHPTNTIIAKSRIGGLKTVVDVPYVNSLREIVEKWQNAGGTLKTHEEAEEIKPESEGIYTAVKTGLEI